MTNHIQFDEEKQKEKLEELHKEEEEKFAQHIAQKNGLPYANLFVTTINPEAISFVEESEAKKAELATIQKTDDSLFVGIKDPQNPATKLILNQLQQKYRLKLLIVSLRSLKKAWESYASEAKKDIKGSLEISATTISSFEKAVKNVSDVKTLFLSAPEDVPRIIELALGASLGLDASDIHFEPQETNIKLRYRIDGVLQDVSALDKKFYKSLLTRIKLIAGIKINITEVPQDGRFTIKLSETDVEVRVSTLPGAYGEDIVMRILHPKSISVPIEELGFQKIHQNIILREIQKPNGIILITGPTGSGKTTTLYAFLKKLNSPEIKIITVEDPVEYHVAGIAQTQVDPSRGLTFASALRSILRQDPDIILLGEMRDTETVEVAIHAALTGHLVFSTLHTNDSLASIPRLIDMGANPSILASAINTVLAQRLVRRICAKCGTKRKITAEELKMFENELRGVSKEYEVPPLNEATEIPNSTGCSFCNNTGYKGRVGIFEIFTLDDEIKNFISQSKNVSIFELKKLASEKKMITLKQEGFIKVLNGLTTIEEIISVVG